MQAEIGGDDDVTKFLIWTGSRDVAAVLFVCF